MKRKKEVEMVRVLGGPTWPAIAVAIAVAALLSKTSGLISV